jgi:hypothetical protein
MGKTISCFVALLAPRVHLMVSVAIFVLSHSMANGLVDVVSMMGWSGATHYNENNDAALQQSACNVNCLQDAHIHKG